MVLRNGQSSHSLKEGILKEESTKGEGDKGLEVVVKAGNNVVMNVECM